MKSILGTGSLFIDTLYFVDDAFLINHKMEKGSALAISEDEFLLITDSVSDVPVKTPGGSCANVVRALANLGQECYLTGKVGYDKDGDDLIENLRTCKVHPLISRSNARTGQVLCFVTPDGERTMRDILGASADLQENDLKSEYFENKSLVHIEGYALIYGGFVEKSAQLAKKSNALISLDLANYKIVDSYFERIQGLLTSYVDIVFANALEAQELTGSPPKEACAAMSALCPLAVVTVGSEGCWVCQRGEDPRHFPAVHVENVVDTTGAGDMFSAGFLDMHLKGRPFDECVMQGSELASKVIQIQGAFLSL